MPESPIQDGPSPTIAGLQSSPQQPTLKRALGLWIAIAMVVGNVIGSGIFLKPPQAAAAAGDFPLIISAWVFGGALCILGGMCFAELAAMMPRAGGLYVYLREAYGRRVSFLFGWSEFILARPASIGALCTASIGLIAVASDWTPSTIQQLICIVSLISVMASLNVVGVLWGGSIQLLTTIVKAGFLLAIIVIPLVLTASGYDSVSIANFATSTEPEHESRLAQFSVVLLAVMWAYNGWHGVTPVAEEVKNPQRNIPLAIFIGIGVLIFLYVGVNSIYHSVLDMGEIAGSGQELVATVGRRVFADFDPAWIRTIVTLMTSLIVCSMLGAVNSNLMNGPRVSFAMGRDSAFFPILGSVHKTFRTPAAAIVVQSIMAIVLVVGSSTYVTLTESETNIFDLLTNFVVFASSFFYMLAVAAVMVLRRKQPDLYRPYRTSGYPFVPIVYLIIYSVFLTYVFLDSPTDSVIGLALVATGYPVCIWFQHHLKNSSDTSR